MPRAVPNRDGYVPVWNKQMSAKPGTRGRKTFAFWTLIVLLFILAFGNLILTVTILGVLRLGYTMQSVELIPLEDTIKFYGDIDLDNLYKRDGRIEGFLEQPVQINSEKSPILINLAGKSGRPTNKVRVDENGTTFRGFLSFDVKSDKETIFSLTDPIFQTLNGARHLKSTVIETNRIRSHLNDDLHIKADDVNLKGAEGTRITGKEVIWSADQDIYLKSINGSVRMDSHNGIYMDMSRISIAQPKTNSYFTTQFKVCVCMPQGKLFRIPIANRNDPVMCDHFSNSHNPCI